MNAAGLWTRVRAGFAPPPPLTVSAFADAEIVVTSGPLAGTKWQTNFAPYQRGILDAFHEPGVEFVVVMGSAQFGKALAVDTPIPTPTGWTLMGSLAVGDEVFDEQGCRCRVQYATDVMWQRSCYRVVFSDGASIDADADHQWYVEAAIWADRPLGTNSPKPASRILTTRVIAETYLIGSPQTRRARHRYAVPVAGPLQLEPVDLPVAPYLLGAWLGDGHQGQPVLSVHESDQEILRHLDREGVSTRTVSRTTGGLLTVSFDPRPARRHCEACGRAFPRAPRSREAIWSRMKAMGLANQKHIPPAYLRASESQRWALLQGLMDTDGFAERNGRVCQFVTTTPGIAEPFGELLSSLGLKFSRRLKSPTCWYRGELKTGQPAHVFHFTAYRDQPVFRLPRKQCRLVERAGSKTRKTRSTQTARRRIVSVTPIPSMPVRCISVDSASHLYLAGRAMVPTHNTAIAVAMVAYHIAHDPCPILVVEPTVDPMAKDFAKNRLDPVVAATPVLRDRVGKKRAKDSSNTILLKTFKGGAIAIGGANSAASLAARSIRLLILDEVDRYPAELPGEGSTINIALKRTAAFRGRRRVLMLSTPTLEGAPIHAWYQRGDQRQFLVPCPACGFEHAYTWRQVRWTDDDPTTARLHCPDCDYAIDDAERVALLARGRWSPTAPAHRERNLVSFHLWEAYSPFSSLTDIVAGFLRARAAQKAGDRAEMHTWQNTTLGEPIAPDAGEGVETHAVLARVEAYEAEVEVPLGACCLTCGVDTQDDRLELLVVGWGPGEEAWLVDRRTLPGDTSQAEPWTALDAVLEQPYRHASGVALYVQASCLDSAGHRTTMVYDYAARQAARRVYAIIGRDGDRPIVSSPSERRWGRNERKVPLYTLGVDASKTLLMDRLKLTTPGPGYIHLPQAEWCDDEFADQLTSERRVLRYTKGVPVHVWRKIRARNEALDCWVYAHAALRLLRPNLPVMAARLASVAAEAARAAPVMPAARKAIHGEMAPVAVARPPARRVVRSGYVGR